MGDKIDEKKLIDEYLGKEVWEISQNANTMFSFSGLQGHISENVIKKYALDVIYKGEIADAHKNGYIYIHDLGHAFAPYCSGWDLKKLLLMGFGGVPSKSSSKPAKHLDTVVEQLNNFAGCASLEFAGAIAFSNFDTYLAPFVKKDKLSYWQVKQEMQKLVFSLNVSSRWALQAVFSNLTFDIQVPKNMKDEKAIIGGKEENFTYGDCQYEMDLINVAFLNIMKEGDKNGRIMTFPIVTYNITDDFDWNSHVADLIFKTTAKYGFPNFMNYCNSDRDPSEIKSLCCRLSLDMTKLMNRPGGLFSIGSSTGSLGVCTINLNRLGIKSKDKKEFFGNLNKYLDLAKESLEIKRKMLQANLDKGLFPYTSVYLGTFRNHFNTIGVIGGHEMCKNFLDVGIETKKGKEFCISILHFIRKKLKDFQKETGNIFNVEEVPGESAGFSLALLDQKKHPDWYLSGTKEVPYLTNSFHLPVGLTEDIFEVIEHQQDIQPLFTGGSVTHCFLGEGTENPEAIRKLVKKICHKSKIPYFTISPTFSVCIKHGYITGKVEKCPQCGMNTEIYSRIVGYYRPISSWNNGKKQEFKDRKTFKI